MSKLSKVSTTYSKGSFLTLEELLNCSASQLEAMTDKELEDHFGPMLAFTRPDRETAIHKEKKTITHRTPKLSNIDQLMLGLSPEKRKMLEDMSKEQGIDLDEL